MDAIPDTNPSAAQPDDGDLGALRAEVAELKARLDTYERILQVRDAVLTATLPAAPSMPAAAPAADAPAAPASPDEPREPLPAFFEVAADQLLAVHDGFYQLEWGPEGAFRWTGPGSEVQFEAWLDRTEPLVATLRLFHFGIPANAKEMAIVVDGNEYPLARQANEKILRSDPIAPRGQDGPTLITLKVPNLHSPAQRGQADKRMLGVAFQRLRIDRG